MDKQNKQPHPHAKLIKAWADGKTLQIYDRDSGKWTDYPGIPKSFFAEAPQEKPARYRVKPERLSEPEDGTGYIYVDSDGSVSGAMWEGTNQDRRRLDFGNVFHDMSAVLSAAERVRATLKGEEPKGEKAVLHPHLNGKPISDGELALIRAIRKVKVEYVWESRGALLIDKADFTQYGDSIAFLTAGEPTADDEIREALNKISQEQAAEQEANND